MGATEIERRRARRVSVQAPFVIRQHSASGTEQVTENVSLAGVYFEMEHGPVFRVSEMVTVSITIPETQRRRFPFTRLAGRGHVVRVNELPGSDSEARKRYGVALEFGDDVTVLTSSPPRTS